jgi:predicted metal-dependent RNase
MDKLMELVLALNEQSIGDDEFGARVTAAPEIGELGELDAKLVQERLVKVAELIGEEVVAKVNGPLNLGTNGDLVASVESELRSRLQIVANATSGVVSDAKIAEIVSW